jgi:hypothetical protein
METSYVAFGLSLHSSFPLPGMSQMRVREGLPELDVALEEPAELEAAWSGGGSPWRGQLGDGEELTIERGAGGDLRFGYGERASFRLDPAGGQLGCAPREVADLDWQRALLTRVLPNVSIARGHEALHACAVEASLGVVAVAAPSGMGKSTLAAELIRRGWPLFADDVLILRRRAGTIEAQPGTPHMNMAGGVGDTEGLGETLGTLAGERWVAARQTCSQGRRVAALILLERGPGLSLGVEPLPGSPLTLAPYMLGLPDDEGRDASRFGLYSDLVEEVRLLRLTGGPRDQPADLADAIERALGLGSPAADRSAA